MKDLNLSPKLNNAIQDFVQKLTDTYKDELVSVVLYGSAASGEYADNHSNLNFLVILKDTRCATLKKASGIIRKFRNFTPLFMTEHYINTSTDIFPVEFLDLKENNRLLYGKDCLSGIQVDIRNLRFQCEQELKIKLLNLRNLYIRFNKDASALRGILFKNITSVLHIARNVLRIKGKTPAYKKEDIIKDLTQEFRIDAALWSKILAAKNKAIRLSNQETEGLFEEFVKELEMLVEAVDVL